MFMVNLVEDILDFSRIQFNKFELVYTWFTVADVISEVADIVDFQIKEKEI